MLLRPAARCITSIPVVSAMHLEQGPLVVRHLLDSLQHKTQVLELISGDDYVRQHEHLFKASVGGHMRHSLDHIRVAVTAARDPATDRLDYDSRMRGTDIERDPASALCAVKQIIDDLNEFNTSSDRSLVRFVHVSFIGDPLTGAAYSVPSSVHRELSFAVHHASHHLFLIRVMMESMGYKLDKNVGIANSTIIHAAK